MNIFFPKSLNTECLPFIADYALESIVSMLRQSMYRPNYLAKALFLRSNIIFCTLGVLSLINKANVIYPLKW